MTAGVLVWGSRDRAARGCAGRAVCRRRHRHIQGVPPAAGGASRGPADRGPARCEGVQATVAAATTETGLMAELARCCRPGRERGGGSWSCCGPGTVTGFPTLRCGWLPRTRPNRWRPLLTAEYVASVAVRSGATQVLLIFDTCFSGGGALRAGRRGPVVRRAGRARPARCGWACWPRRWTGRRRAMTCSVTGWPGCCETGRGGRICGCGGAHKRGDPR